MLLSSSVCGYGCHLPTNISVKSMNVNPDILFKLLPEYLALVTYTTFILHCTNTMQQGCNWPTGIYKVGVSVCVLSLISKTTVANQT